MLRGDGNENSQKTSEGLISKKTKTLHVQHTFLYISLPLFCTTTTRNFQELPSYTFHVFLITFFPPPFNLVAASISPFSHGRYNFFLFFFQRNWSPLFFISRSSSFSVTHVNVDIGIKSKERIGREAMPKHANAWNANFIPAYMKGLKNVRTIFSEPKVALLLTNLNLAFEIWNLIFHSIKE